MSSSECQNKFIPGIEEIRFYTSNLSTDREGNPRGGYAIGSGFTIVWRDYHGDKKNQVPGDLSSSSGALLKDVINSCIDRLEQFQNSKIRNDNYNPVLTSLRTSLKQLEKCDELTS